MIFPSPFGIWVYCVCRCRIQKSVGRRGSIKTPNMQSFSIYWRLSRWLKPKRIIFTNDRKTTPFRTTDWSPAQQSHYILSGNHIWQQNNLISKMRRLLTVFDCNMSDFVKTDCSFLNIFDFSNSNVMQIRLMCF